MEEPFAHLAGKQFDLWVIVYSFFEFPQGAPRQEDYAPKTVRAAACARRRGSPAWSMSRSQSSFSR